MKKPRVLVENSGFKLCMTSESGGTRTLDPRIKRYLKLQGNTTDDVMLQQLRSITI